jgi:hypothetical protein
MPNAGAPSGPAKPVKQAREKAEQREQIDEALRPDPDLAPHGGHAVTRNQPSPEARDEDVPNRPDRPPQPDKVGRQR